AGAGRVATIVYAVVPQIAATMVSYVLYVFEINVRASVIIGLVGAGGIGFTLQQRLNFFDYTGVGLIILVIFVVVRAIDALSVWATTRLLSAGRPPPSPSRRPRRTCAGTACSRSASPSWRWRSWCSCSPR